jgi:flavin-binding protein dodecin
MSVLNTIDLVGVSDRSWGDAAREALREASKTIRRITKMDVIDTACTVDGDKIVEYRTPVRLYFEVEPARR